MNTKKDYLKMHDNLTENRLIVLSKNLYTELINIGKNEKYNEDTRRDALFIAEFLHSFVGNFVLGDKK